MSRHSDPAGALLLGMGVGIFLFYKGFRSFREYEVLADTPRIPIRSVPMGFVHIRGKAESAGLLTSPLTKTSCCFYRVEIDRWKTHDRSSGWEHFCTDADGYKFHVADETGGVLVDAHAAEYDLPQTQERIVDSASPSAAGMGSGAGDTELLNYVTYAQTHHMSDAVSQFLEHRLGKLSQRGALDPSKQQKIEALQQFVRAIPDVQRTGHLPMDAIERALSSTGPLADPEKEAHRQQALEHFRQMQATQIAPELSSGLQPTPAQGRYRLREYLILPGQEYFVSGTCMENPEPHDAQDRNLISKGPNEPTFLISSQPAQQATGKIRKGSLKMVFTGAGLTLVCLALLLGYWKMF